MAEDLVLRNGQAAPLSKVPVLDMGGVPPAPCWRPWPRGSRLSAFFGRRLASGETGLLAVLADDTEGVLSLLAADPADSYPALTPVCPQAHLFEREVFEQFGIAAAGASVAQAGALRSRERLAMDFYRVEGEEVHEVAVGPVHAGVIEPGHFRFQCHGELVKHLEISLGYQHRGVERALLGGPDRRSVHLMETLAGDTTVGHGWAYCQARGGPRQGRGAAAGPGLARRGPRAGAHRQPYRRSGRLGRGRGILAHAVLSAAACAATRSISRPCSAAAASGAICCRPGGVAHDADAALAAEMSARLETLGREAASAVNLLWDSPSVTGRFEETGAVSLEDCRRLGLVGPAARACGLNQDVRRDLPFGIYRYAMIPVSSWHTGDVFGRAQVRWLEVQRSLQFVRELLASLPGGAVRREVPAAAARACGGLFDRGLARRDLPCGRDRCARAVLRV